MNQQRQRRFRSAKDARELLEKEREKRKGTADAEVPLGTPFDSNCITYGSSFALDVLHVYC